MSASSAGKQNVGSLSEFVRVACANELGLGNPAQAQPVSLSKRSYRPRGLDLTDQQCDQITALRRLAAPAQGDRSGLATGGRAGRLGQGLFASIGARIVTRPIWARPKGSTAISCCTAWEAGWWGAALMAIRRPSCPIS